MLLENLIKLPLNELLTYKEGLESLSRNYEKRLLPMYGMVGQYDEEIPNQIDLRNKLTKTNHHLSLVYQAIETQITSRFNELETEIKTDNVKLNNVKKNSKKN